MTTHRPFHLSAVLVLVLALPALTQAAPDAIAPISSCLLQALDLASGAPRAHVSDVVYTYTRQWGSSGSGDGQFNQPRGIVVDDFGKVYVVDSQNHRIQKFASDGTYRAQWGSQGTDDGDFEDPDGICIDSNRRLYVADAGNHRVQKLYSDGAFARKWGSSGTGNGEFDLPTGIDIASNGRVYVSDRGNDRVQKFMRDGTYVTQWGSSGTGDGQFTQPSGVAVNSAGRVYVGDMSAMRVQKFASDGTFARQWGSGGTGNGQFDLLQGVAVDPFGNVLIVDRRNHRVQVFNSGGGFVTSFGSLGAGDGQFNHPWDAACDSTGRFVYVTDALNRRVQKFERTETVSTLDDGALAVSSLSAVPTAAGAQITFRLSSAAAVSARVLNIAGRPVCILCRDYDGRPGSNTLLWSARTDSGLAAPSGTYLVELTAARADGSQARALTQVQLAR